MRGIWRVIVIGLLVNLTGCTLSTLPPSPTAPPTLSLTARPPTLQPTRTAAPTHFPAAVSRTAAQGIVTSADGLYHVDQPVPPSVCAVTPSDVTANIRHTAGTDAALIGVLPVDHWITAVRLSDLGWYQVSLPDTPVDGGWIAQSVVMMQQGCACNDITCEEIATVSP